MCSKSSRLSMALLLLLSSCSAAPKLPMPQYCSPVPGRVLCSDEIIEFPDAGKLMCFKPQEIEPFLERFGKRTTEKSQ